MSGLKVIDVITHERFALRMSFFPHSAPTAMTKATVHLLLGWYVLGFFHFFSAHLHRHAIRNSNQIHRSKRLHRISTRNIRYNQPARC